MPRIISSWPNSSAGVRISTFERTSSAATYAVPGSYSNPVLAALLKHWSLDRHISARSAFPVDLVGSTGQDPTTQATLNYEPDLVPGQPMYLYGPQLVDGQMINLPEGASSTSMHFP